MTLDLGVKKTFDRFIIKEELREGQNVLEFVISAGGVQIFNGSISPALFIVAQFRPHLPAFSRDHLLTSAHVFGQAPRSGAL